MMAAYHIKCLRYQDSTQERLVTVFKDDCEHRPADTERDLHIRIAKDIKSQHLPESSIYIYIYSVPHELSAVTKACK